MTQPLTFIPKMRNTGITAYREYVAEVTVAAPYALHIEFDGAAQPSPVAFRVEQKSDGAEYVTVDTVAQSLIKGRRFKYDRDFPGEAWPKQVQITSPYPVLQGSVITGSATNAEVSELVERLNKLDGSNDTTEEIDSLPEVRDFLSGMKQGDTIQDVINSSHEELSDEQLDGIKTLFPTA